MLYVQMADTAHNQIEVLLVCINDPYAPRFDIDRDWQGEPTKLGTLRRNLPAEIEAITLAWPPDRSAKGYA